MKILLTGAAGFLGRAVVARLEERGDQTRGFDSSFGDDVTDAVSFDSALATFRPDAVVHLAALLTPECAADPARGALVNCVGTAIALHRSLRAGVRSIVFASSVAAIEPGSVYGATKAFGEHVAVAMRSEHPDARVIALRLGWVYGQGRTRGWVDLQAVIEGFALEHTEVRYPDYREPLDWTHVDDASEAVVACLDRAPSSARVYDLAGDRRPVADAVRHLCHRFPRVRTATYDATTPPSAWSALDGSRLERETGFRPRIPLEDGLDRTVDAIRRAHGLAPVGGRYG